MRQPRENSVCRSSDRAAGDGPAEITSRSPDEVIAWNGSDPLTGRRFHALIEDIARTLPARRFVFNVCSDPLHYLLGFCAAIRAGQCALMPPNRLEATLDDIRRDYGDSYVLGNDAACEYNIGDALARGGSYAGRPGARPVIPEQQLCAIAFTSGSTGRPQAHYKYWRTLLTGAASSARIVLRDVGLPASILSTVPPQHMWGLETSILLPMVSNVSVGGRLPFYPLEIKEALEALPAPRILVSTPLHLRALLHSGLDLVAVRRMLSATAPLTGELAAQLEETFNTSVLEIFGSSETGILASRRVSTEDKWTLAEVFDLDAADGRTRISARHLPEDVFLQDTVEQLSAREFRWLGRHQDMVNIAGKRASLTDLTRRLLEIEGVGDGVLFFPDDGESRLAAMVVAPGLTPNLILQALRTQIDAVFLPRPLVLVERLPRSETGKLPRQALLELFGQLRRAGAGDPCC